jgi:hypothetical protein
MECIRRNGHDFVPVKTMLAWGCRIAFFTALGFGMGAVAIIPWLAKTSVWQSARAEKMAESMLNQAARCEGRMMVMERACPMRVRANAAAQNIGGEEP